MCLVAITVLFLFEVLVLVMLSLVVDVVGKVVQGGNVGVVLAVSGGLVG